MNSLQFLFITILVILALVVYSEARYTYESFGHKGPDDIMYSKVNDHRGSHDNVRYSKNKDRYNNRHGGSDEDLSSREKDRYNNRHGGSDEDLSSREKDRYYHHHRESDEDMSSREKDRYYHRHDDMKMVRDIIRESDSPEMMYNKNKKYHKRNRYENNDSTVMVST